MGVRLIPMRRTPDDIAVAEARAAARQARIDAREARLRARGFEPVGDEDRARNVFIAVDLGVLAR